MRDRRARRAGRGGVAPAMALTLAVLTVCGGLVVCAALGAQRWVTRRAETSPAPRLELVAETPEGCRLYVAGEAVRLTVSPDGVRCSFS